MHIRLFFVWIFLVGQEKPERRERRNFIATTPGTRTCLARGKKIDSGLKIGWTRDTWKEFKIILKLYSYTVTNVFAYSSVILTCLLLSWEIVPSCFLSQDSLAESKGRVVLGLFFLCVLFLHFFSIFLSRSWGARGLLLMHERLAFLLKPKGLRGGKRQEKVGLRILSRFYLSFLLCRPSCMCTYGPSKGHPKLLFK